MPHEILMSLAAGAVALAASAALAIILRATGMPGWRIAGGVIAGLVLGPAVLGSAWPSAHEALFIGAAEERAAMDRVESQQTADRLAALEAGGPSAAAALDRDHGEAERAAVAALRDGIDRDAAGRRWIVAALAGLVLLGTGVLRGPSGANHHGRVAPLSIGVWAAGLPAAAALWAVGWAWGYGRGTALLVAAALAIGPWAIRAADRRSADEVEHGGASLIERAGLVSTLIAGLCAALAAFTLDGPFRHESGLWLLAAAPLGWLLPRMRETRLIRESFDVVLIPSLAAWATLRVDPPGDLALWPIVILLVVAGDVRWLGGLTGALLPGGRRGLRSMRLVLGSMACGPTQLAVTAIAAWWMALPGVLTAALVFAALAIELLSPVRSRMSDRLAQTEAELDELHDGSE
jgi:hypothetical protein